LTSIILKKYCCGFSYLKFNKIINLKEKRVLRYFFVYGIKA